MATSGRELFEFLRRVGASSSAEIQAALDVSQPTVSRLAASVSDEVLLLGKGRSTRYAVAEPIGMHGAQQPVWLINAAGQAEKVGILSLLAGPQIHVQGPGINDLFTPGRDRGELPWYLTPLRAQGFLGKILAAQVAGADTNPEKWDTPEILQAALQTYDAPGAILLGDSGERAGAQPSVLKADDLDHALDAQAQDVANTLPRGSSAGGEQPKFLAINADDERLLVKFSPPLETPYGARWHDLLLAEALVSRVLNGEGMAAASSEAVTTSKRTFLVSKRFDRTGRHGRRHVVSVGAVHTAFVKGSYQNWASTCDALAAQGRLREQDASDARDLLHFGRLIGNTDMHSGNASLFVTGGSLAEIAKGRFRLAPCYDMLPMRYRPDVATGAPDYDSFVPDVVLISQRARAMAQVFWDRLAREPRVSTALQYLATEMASRLRGA